MPDGSPLRIGIAGGGRVGVALGVLLARAGHRIVAVSGREGTAARVARHLPRVPVVDAADDVVPDAELVLVTVPDAEIAAVAARVASRPLEGRWVAHCSGALGLAPLAPVAAAGGRRLAVHPLQTFPDVERAIAEIPGCAVAVTADDADGIALGTSLARDLGAVPFTLADEDRPLYHAAAVLASNDLVVLAWAAEGLLASIGVPDPPGALAPLQRATVDNVAAMGPAAALTGPVVRGDSVAVEANLAALAARAPAWVPTYVVMARAALDLAVTGGRLGEDGRAAVAEVLDRWT
jgi:predicted short-subunit dehydrogenase-like oxidoreductase (DUF2520 family)